ncbi:MAG: hypothetical protein J5766_02190, partial [Clostridia bacterium]|nr:hypothetical protein [Clostridia bacterium]
MKTACEFNREIIRETNPLLSYSGENFNEWQKKAREKLSSLLGIDTFKIVDDDLDIEYETETEK